MKNHFDIISFFGEEINLSEIVKTYQRQNKN